MSQSSLRRQKLAFLPAFLILFFFYQIPEGIGGHLLQSFPIQAGLIVFFYLVAYVVARGLGYQGFAAYAMELQPGWFRNLSITLLLAVLLKSLALYLGHQWGIYAITTSSAQYAFLPFLLTVLAALVTTWFPSAAEDIVTRGIWYRNTSLAQNKTLFVVLSSAIYVLNHIYRLGNGPLEWVMLFCFGLAYAAALVRTGSLWAAIGLHWGWNIAGTLSDEVLQVTVLSETAAPLLSAGTHLAMLLILLVFTPLLAVNPESPAGKQTI